MKQLKLNELFSGIGTQAYALEYLGIPFEVVGMAEIEKNAIKAYEAGHGKTRNYGDISKIDKLVYADFWTYSFPCFTGDMRVYTEAGHKYIKDIEVGDRVYSHKERFCDVVNFFNNGEKEIYELETVMGNKIKTTKNHMFYVIEKSETELWDSRSNCFVYVYSQPKWKKCKDLTENDSLFTPLLGVLEELFEDIEDKDILFVNCTSWIGVKSVINTGKKEVVYDIEVENDHSFVIEGIIAHNCQDLSSAGKGQGVSAVNEYGERVHTRSGLLWEVERLLARSCGYDIVDGVLVKNEKYNVDCPKYLLLENVPELITNKKHRTHFDIWLDRLDELGYVTSYGVLNGKDFGVPQNRERVFALSVREDVCNETIAFPNPSSFLEPPKEGLFEDFVDKEVLEYVGDLKIDEAIANYLLPAYTRDLQKISRSQKDIFTCVCKSGFIDHRVGIRYAPTIRHKNQHTAIFFNNQIHKLTDSECWKFMGIKEEDFYKVKNETGLSRSILQGLAGNAIVVPVLMSLFNQVWRIENGLNPYEYNEVPFLNVKV